MLSHRFGLKYLTDFITLKLACAEEIYVNTWTFEFLIEVANEVWLPIG